ncbi:hypothetical protein J4G02_15315 [Candidatus Poribacteria bacterium]|nr:hypothetical protein [Candidatus Poribacteria bacterium]
MKVFGFACIVIIGLIIFAMLLGTSRNPGDTTTGNNSQTYIDRGKAKADDKTYFAAISDYDMAISLNPANADAYLLRGFAKREIGGYPQANEDFERGRQLAEEMGNGKLQLLLIEAMSTR